MQELSSAWPARAVWQIAKILGSSVGAVKANFFHALNKLKRLLEDELLRSAGERR